MIGAIDSGINMPTKITLFECEIPGRVGIKKNGKLVIQRFGRTVVLPSDRYTQWERASEIYVLQAKNKYKLPIETAIEAHFEFHFKNGQAEPDTSNCIEGPQDLLKKMGVIVDDKLIVKLSAVKKLYLEPKTVIRLYAYVAEDKPEVVLTE